MSTPPAAPFTRGTAPPVRGWLHRPSGGGHHGLALTHGAGSDAGAPLLVALADRLAAAGVTVLRFDLPFRQARRRGPASPATAARDRAGIANAVRVLQELAPGRLFAGGHSYGGRQTSVLVAEETTPVEALLLLAYPLHPPGRPQQARTAHLPGITIPTMFVHGTRDPFGTLEEIEAARRLIPVRTTVLAVAGGHDLSSPRIATTLAVLAERVAAQFLAFAEQARAGQSG